MFFKHAKGNHSILHSHHGIHYHLNDAPVEASICWLTVAWDASSLFVIYLIMLAGGLQSCWPTPVLTSRLWRLQREWKVGIESKVDYARSLGMYNTAVTYNKRPLGRSLSFWNGVRTNAGEIINLVSPIAAWEL